MGFFQAAIGNVISIAVLCLFVAGVLKVFQIHTALTEIKEVLTNIKNRQDFTPVETPPPAHPLAPSGEEMLRALDRELNLEQSSPAIDPEVVDPR